MSPNLPRDAQSIVVFIALAWAASMTHETLIRQVNHELKSCLRLQAVGGNPDETYAAAWKLVRLLEKELGRR